MSRKVFVSYKYGDTSVQPLKPVFDEYLEPTKVRDYVTDLQDILKDTQINKGEDDGESLQGFKDETITSKLRDKIYDSSVTIVVISPDMKDRGLKEEEQWIPWEVSYSLREKTRDGRTSCANAVLAIVLPDRTGSYEYFIRSLTCCSEGCRWLMTNTLFAILRANMFNQKASTVKTCSQVRRIYYGDSSYVLTVKWNDFKANPTGFIEHAVKINENIESYKITKSIDAAE